MEKYKQDFIAFMVEAGVLAFGDFVTKSGRRTPFFINTGNYRTGSQMLRLGHYYAEAIHNTFGDKVDIVFGPAYKGIPLAVATAMMLSAHYGREVAFCYNRKEIKDHGEGGALVGQKPRLGDRVVIVEDVITAGTSIRETMPLLQTAAEVKVTGLVVSVDRMERGHGQQAAMAELQEEFGFCAVAITNIREVVGYLHNRQINGKVYIDDEQKERIEAYLAEYGVR